MLALPLNGNETDKFDKTYHHWFYSSGYWHGLALSHGHPVAGAEFSA